MHNDCLNPAFNTANKVQEEVQKIQALGDKHRANPNTALHQNINNRPKEHILNEQASKQVGQVTAPIDFDGHIINAELKYNKRTKSLEVKGGHSNIPNNNIRVDAVTQTFPNGVYIAKISAKDPRTGQYLPKSNNKGESTLFPDSWTADRIKVEVDYAFKHRKPHSTGAKNMWEGTTKSGVKVEGFLSPNTTVYPSKSQ